MQKVGRRLKNRDGKRMNKERQQRRNIRTREEEEEGELGGVKKQNNEVARQRLAVFSRKRLGEVAARRRPHNFWIN